MPIQIVSILEAGANIGVARQEEIEVCRLDELFGSLGLGVGETRILLKIDTQGYDLEVFLGASGCIEYIHGLMSEVSVIPIYKGMVDYKTALLTYEDAGFKLRSLATVSRNSNNQIVELNCLMSR